MANKRKCKYCGEYVKEFITTPIASFCNYDHASKYGYANKHKGADKIHRVKKKAFKEEDRKIRLPAAQKSFNAFIRERDKDLPCMSCKESRKETAVHKGSNFHAGHYKSVGSKPELRFEELNCHKQCAYCNNFLSGNMENYRINLIEKIGLDKVEWLEGPHEPKKYTCADLKEIEQYFKSKLKVLKLNSTQL